MVYKPTGCASTSVNLEREGPRSSGKTKVDGTQDMEPRDVEWGVRRPKMAVGIGRNRQRGEGIDWLVEFGM